MFLPLFDWPTGCGGWNKGFGCGPGGVGSNWNSCGDGGFGCGWNSCGDGGPYCGIGGWRPGGCGPCAGYLSDRFGNGWNPGCWRGPACGGIGNGLFGFW